MTKKAFPTRARAKQKRLSPDDRRKERFRSHEALVIRQPEEFAPSPELAAFVSQIKEASR